MNFALPLAHATLIAAAVGPALANGPPKCDEAAKRAWYQRAVEMTDGDAAREALPQWCWLENPSAKSAPRRSANAPRAMAADASAAIDGTFRSERPSMSPGALRGIAIHDDTFSAED